MAGFCSAVQVGTKVQARPLRHRSERAARRNPLRLAVAACGLFLATPAFADLVGENLLVVLPPGYKIDFQQKNARLIHTEMVPVAQSVKDWSEMLTVQVFLGQKRTPESFKLQLGQLWTANCADSRAADIWRGEENGYSALIWLLACPLNKATGKPEITWFKGIQGNDSFYLVQKAYKFMPTPEQNTPWMQYLTKVSVCDSRLPDRACPKVDPPAR